ncbi:PhnD/SsuA/transferrin family substrate-binding protein [Aquamicrobium lusatiense]|uniref:PhnD/SsuA/transferrin family substrate-binding protein n=1 Tax=Aquamicrobium lusatiense TaxID=89772 RepID=UPI002455AB6B|nr:PhnD/SsuA/transferrin family substrate-binding protein [Aquamicrobium lusatiense]MDH4989332.1 PhnD/SsuA/transferrin family substrate-binding protein [Aquamicrobium lusatiense]
MATLAGLALSVSLTSALATDKAASSVLRVGYVGFEKGAHTSGVEGFLDFRGELRPLLEKAGIKDFTIVALPNGTNVNEALASDQIDIGLLGDTPAVIGRANGLKTRLLNIQPDLNAWLIAKVDGPKTVEELRGKTVATAQGSYMSKYLLGLLKEAGLEGETTFVSLIPPDGKAALERGDIAAFAYPAGFAQDILAEGFVAIDDAGKHPSLLGAEVAVVSDNYLSNNPDFPKIWSEIYQASVKAAHAEPDAFYAFFSEATGYKVESLKAAYPLSHWREESLPLSGLEQVRATSSFLLDQGIASDAVDVEAWVAR